MKIKRHISLLAVLMLCIVLIAGCGETNIAEVVPTPPPVEEKDPEALEIEDFFNKYVNTDERPIAVMIDNDDKNARPHAGLNDAYLIYEMVVEGGATRFLALFNGVNTEKIGPVRSSRHYFLDYVMENDAIYTHFGWSPKASQDIPAYGINNINGVLGGDGNIFWRERKFKGDWHSAYTSIEKIKNMAGQKGYSDKTTHKNGIKYNDNYYYIALGNIANKVSLRYSGGYNTSYNYNAETKLYEKSINGAPHVMQNGDVLEVKNIIIELVDDTSLGDGTARRNINTTGSGKGYFITNGEYEEITWSKSSRRDNTVYKRLDGRELYVNPGKTIINLISPSKGAVIE